MWNYNRRIPKQNAGESHYMDRPRRSVLPYRRVRENKNPVRNGSQQHIQKARSKLVRFQKQQVRFSTNIRVIYEPPGMSGMLRDARTSMIYR